MPTSKKPITFAPSDKVRAWYDKLEPGRRTKILNICLEQYCTAGFEKALQETNELYGNMLKRLAE